MKPRFLAYIKVGWEDSEGRRQLKVQALVGGRMFEFKHLGVQIEAFVGLPVETVAEDGGIQSFG